MYKNEDEHEHEVSVGIPTEGVDEVKVTGDEYDEKTIMTKETGMPLILKGRKIVQ